MAITEALRLVIDADARGAVQGIQQVGRTADRELSRAEQSLDRWGSRLTTVGAGLISFGAVAAYGLNQAAQSAGQLEQAVGGTEAVFDDATGVIDRYARSAAENAGLSETAFRTATTQIGGNLKRLGLDVDEAAQRSVELTQVAADLAATYGGTTAEAVTALGAAFRGEADPAERFNLDLRTSKVNAEAVALGLATSTSAVDDHARAQAILSLVMKQSADAQGQFNRESDTLAGRQAILSARFENLKADIGEGVIPAMEQLFNVASTGIDAFSGLNSATGGALGKLATVGTVAALGVGGLSLLIGQAIKMRHTLVDAASGVGDLITKLRALSAAQLVAGGLAAGIAAVAVALDQYNRAEQQANTERLTSQFLAAGESAKEMEEVFRSAVKHGPAELVGTFAQLAQSNREAAERFIETAEAAGVSDRVLTQMRDHLETTAAAERQTAVDTEALGGAMGEQAGSTEEATSALQEYQDTLSAAFDPVFGMIDAQQGLRDAQASVAEAQAALNEALASGDPTAIAEAQRNYEDALSGSSRALVDAQGAQAVLNDAVERNPALLQQARDSMFQWAIQAGYSAEQASFMAGQIGVATDAARTLDAQNVDVPIAATDNATFTIRSVDTELENLDGKSATVTVKQLFQTVGQAFGFAGGRAHGGPVSGGRLYEVAEQGRAELLEMAGRTYLIPGSDGTVVPSGNWGGGGMGGGGSYVDNRTINVYSGADPQAVVEALKRYERTNGPDWRN